MERYARHGARIFAPELCPMRSLQYRMVCRQALSARANSGSRYWKRCSSIRSESSLIVTRGRSLRNPRVRLQFQPENLPAGDAGP